MTWKSYNKKGKKEKLLELFLDENTKHRKIEGDAKFIEFLSYETSVLTVFIPSSLILIWHLVSFRSSQQFIFIIASALATVNSAFYKHYTCFGAFRFTDVPVGIYYYMPTVCYLMRELAFKSPVMYS